VTDLKSNEQVTLRVLDTETILVTGFIRAEGSLVLLSGLTQDSREVIFACERRYVADVFADLETGLESEALVPLCLITETPTS
jgi:hypothetical protein